MKTHYFTFFAFLIFSSGISQTFEWVQTPEINFNLNPEMVGYSVVNDSEGNLYFCGFKDHATPHISILGHLWFSKYAEDGTLLFSKVISGEVTIEHMIVDQEDNILAAFSYLSNIKVDDFEIESTNFDLKFILLKFNANGNLLWHKPIDAGNISTFNAIATDNEQNYYIGYGDFFSTFIEKIDALGNPISMITQQNVALVTSLGVDSQGYIYASGSCADLSATFGDTMAETNLNYNTYLVKYNNAGQLQWLHFFPEITCSFPKLIVGADDHIFYSSNLTESHLFGSFQTQGPTFGLEHFFITKLNPEGAFLWVKETPVGGVFNLGNRNYLATDAEGSVYLTGSTKGNSQWSETISTSVEGVFYDAAILKYDLDGNVLWAKTAGGGFNDRFNAINVDVNGNVYVAGIVHESATFDTFTVNQENYFPVVSKINQNTLHLPNNDFENITYYPNPVTETLYISKAPLATDYVIYNTLGQQIGSGLITTSDNMGIDFKNYVSGIYFVKIGANSPIKIIRK